MNLEDRKILVDVHEPKDVVEKISKLGFPVEIMPLQAGDVVVGDILIERKDIDDFFSSLHQGRLFDQLHKMMTTEKKCILAIIGTYPYQYKYVDDLSYVYKKIWNVKLVSFLSFRTMLVTLKTFDDFLDLIKDCWNRTTSESYIPVVKKKIKIEDIKTDVLSRVPGIGGVVATELAKEYKIIDLINMSTDQLCKLKIRGRRLGKRGEKIKEVFWS